MDTIWTELMGLELRQHYIDVAGVRTRCLEAGQGHPLVLLHGGGGHLEAYARNIQALSQHFHLYVVDLLGHGYTARPPIEKYSYMTFVRFIGDLQNAIGANEIYLAGLSIGAMSAATYAGQNPKRVKKLVLNTGVPLLADEEGRNRWRTSIEMRRGITNEGAWTRESVKTRLGRVFHDGDNGVPDELVEVRYKIYSQPGFTKYNNDLIENLLIEIIEENDFTTRIGPEALRAIECPTILLWTTVNPGQGIGVAREAHSMLRDGKLVVFEKSGHWPQWEEPEKYNRLITEFMTA